MGFKSSAQTAFHFSKQRPVEEGDSVMLLLLFRHLPFQTLAHSSFWQYYYERPNFRALAVQFRMRSGIWYCCILGTHLLGTVSQTEGFGLQ